MRCVRTFSFIFFFLLNGVLQCQCNPGLHAGIQAQLIWLNDGGAAQPHIQLSFLLLNDSRAAVESHPELWKVIVNGTALKDSSDLFGNGPMPVGGYQTLNPGEHYELGKALPVSTYFPHPGEYKISWKGQGFESPTITVIIPTPASSKAK
jgi:hypothetical protein